VKIAQKNSNTLLFAIAMGVNSDKRGDRMEDYYLRCRNCGYWVYAWERGFCNRFDESFDMRGNAPACKDILEDNISLWLVVLDNDDFDR